MYKVVRPIQERNKHEIEKKILGMGDYVKMSYLQRALQSDLDFDTRKFVLIRLAGIYESRMMFLEAARLVKGAAEINTTFKDKIRDYMKSLELFIRAGNFAEAELLFPQIISLSSLNERPTLKEQKKSFYLAYGKNLIQHDRRSLARTAYEKILTLELSPEERRLAQLDLSNVYEKLGLVKEYMSLKRKMEDLSNQSSMAAGK